jgi:hypothetical protein
MMGDKPAGLVADEESIVQIVVHRAWVALPSRLTRGEGWESEQWEQK